MKLYEITIKPISVFGTPVKGDTVFGHLCWQAAYDPTLLEGGLDRWIKCYEGKPFLICSSAWPKLCDDNNKTSYAVKRPDLPPSFLFRFLAEDKKTRMEERKENQKKKWLLLDGSLSLNMDEATYKTDKDLLDMARKQVTEESRRLMRGKTWRQFCAEFEQQHNTINRMTMTTGEGMFAPFTEMASYYYPETELAIFVLIDEEATDIERVYKAFGRIGQFGFGKDASTGWGRFEMAEYDEIGIPKVKSPNAGYVLSPVVPEKDMFSGCYFTPFVRFGRHGDILARSRNPFKNPIIMADEGAVFVTNKQEVFAKPYIGRAVLNCSKSMEKTVHQGYAIYLPFKLEMQHE